MWKNIIISISFILIITSFFWAPLLEQKASAEYEVFQSGRMERTDVLVAYKLDFSDLFYTPKTSTMIFGIGLVTMLGLILTPIAIKKMTKEKKYVRPELWKMYLFCLIAGMVSLIMTLKIFPFEYLPSSLKMLQFSFRMLEFSGFFLSFVLAINLGIMVKEIKSKHLWIILSIFVITNFFYFDHFYYREDFKEETLWPAVVVTENTGRVHAGCASFEYLPTKAFTNRSYIETRDKKVHVLEGNIEIIEEQKEKSNLSFTIKQTGEKSISKVELPYIYYVGYRVYQEGKELKTYETEMGFVGIEIPEGKEGKIEVSYKGSNIMQITAALSITGMIFLIYCSINKKGSRN